jgi:hypothetical protein
MRYRNFGCRRRLTAVFGIRIGSAFSLVTISRSVLAAARR